MTITYYVPKTADGADTPTQARRYGTPEYGYATLSTAMRYAPVGGYVETRHTDGINDWAGNTVHYKEA